MNLIKFLKILNDSLVWIRLRFATLTTSGMYDFKFSMRVIYEKINMLFAHILRHAQDERSWNANESNVAFARDVCRKAKAKIFSIREWYATEAPLACSAWSNSTPPARGERSGAESNPYEWNAVNAKPGFTIIESVLTLVIIATSLTAIFSLQTKVMRSVFGTHDIIEHLIGVRNFVVKDEQEEYFKQGKGIEKKVEDRDYSITYEPKSSKQFPALSNYKNIVVEKIKISSKSVFINHDDFVFFRFNPEGKK